MKVIRKRNEVWGGVDVENRIDDNPHKVNKLTTYMVVPWDVIEDLLREQYDDEIMEDQTMTQMTPTNSGLEIRLEMNK